MEKIKLLIVEDEFLSAMTLSMILERLGYDLCRNASSGEQALRVAEQEAPDVVLLDIGLKGDLDGIDTAKELIKRFHTSIAFITGYEDQDLRRQAEELHAIGYFLKPLNIDQLHAAIEQAVLSQRS